MDWKTANESGTPCQYFVLTKVAPAKQLWQGFRCDTRLNKWLDVLILEAKVLTVEKGHAETERGKMRKKLVGKLELKESVWVHDFEHINMFGCKLVSMLIYTCAYVCIYVHIHEYICLLYANNVSSFCWKGQGLRTSSGMSTWVLVSNTIAQ